VVDVSGSSYSAGVLVVTGAPGSFEFLTCGPQTISFPDQAGVTYYVLIFDYQGDGSGNGGTLQLTVEQMPPPPAFTATVDATGSFDPVTGSATVHGTMSCTGVVDIAVVDVQLHQRVGRGEVVGENFTDLSCDGTPRPWQVQIFPTFGQKFAGGKAASLTLTLACGPFECAKDFNEYRVQLSRNG
jgi:hypothetical protein